MTAARSTHSGGSSVRLSASARQIDIARKEGLVELAGEDVSLVDNGERCLRVLLAGRPDDTDLYRDSCGAQVGCALFGWRGLAWSRGAEDSGVLRDQGFAAVQLVEAIQGHQASPDFGALEGERPQRGPLSPGSARGAAC